MHDQPQRQAERIGEQMPLAPVHLLAGIEPPRAARLGCLDALAVDDPGRWRRLTAGLLRAAMSSVIWILDQIPSCENRRK